MDLDSLNQSVPTLTPNKNRSSRKVTKLLHNRKTKSNDKVKHDKPITTVDRDRDQKFQKRAEMDAFISKLFATISSVKAAYARLQYAQSPYDAEGIQSADQIMVSELKTLSESKQLFLKKQIDDNTPHTTQLLAEIQEQKNLIQMYEITGKTLDSQRKVKHSEIILLKEKLEKYNRENKLIEKRLNSSGQLPLPLSHNYSSLTTTNFVPILQQTTKSIRNFVKLLMSEMEAANWDLNAAADSIQPDVVFHDTVDKCHAFESFVCRVMFDGFKYPMFSITNDSQSSQFFHDNFMELKSLKSREYIAWKPNSMFAKFCWFKYLKLVHPLMEISLFGNTNQRNLVGSGKFPETTFFASFADVAKRVWLLHCLTFVFGSNKASIFQVKKGSRFTEIYMESVNQEPPEKSPEVAFTVVPGFTVGRTVIQCQVYLS